jgi:carboxyl-terminal processing protease
MNKQMSLKKAVALMLCASALTCVLVLAFVGRYLGLGTDMFGEIRTYIELRRDIRDAYIGEYEGKDVSEAALAAAVTALDDRWSYYMTPEEYREYINASNNQYTGLGISVRKDEETGGLLIANVFEGAPAEKSGIVAGDIIMAIDGTDITALSFNEAASLIGGQPGMSVRLTVTGKDGTSRDVDVEYAIIETHPVNFKLLEGNVGYIQIKNFEGGAGDEFIAAAEELIRQGAAAFVFDVRNNGGGKVTELTGMLDYLLPACDIFVSVDKSGGEEIIQSGPENVKLPSVVLVNGYSFSAAEYFAACLGEYDYATVVGQQTTGKNRSQITLELPDGGALHISSGEYLTPNRVSLTEQGGLKPDVEMTLSDEDNALLYSGQLDASKDTQLHKALELLKLA